MCTSLYKYSFNRFKVKFKRTWFLENKVKRASLSENNEQGYIWKLAITLWKPARCPIKHLLA
jgi:hypothetical protein